ncbi:hypothetical protein ACFQL1_13855 [Halomicroarcula sp. GCM10025709]|uniref:DUF7266 family protein n=1 Tax=Haloarcula TaxID=2237 RepID=UPI0024C2ED52|nr:hypothetical protein [Halomicroarcula sp. YJ-61-S]
MDSRGLSTVVERLLGLGVVVLYIGLLTTTLYGGVVPEYRSAVGTELGERTLVQSAARVEGAVPPRARHVTAGVRVDLPATIDGTAYTIRTDGGALVLDHPDPSIGGRVRPVLPPRVSSFDGTWESGERTVVTVDGGRGNVTVTLEGS